MNVSYAPLRRVVKSLSRPAMLCFALLCVIVFHGVAVAQLAGKGAVSGTVLDPTGAAIPGATVVITNDATSIATTTTSTSAGDYAVETLDAGVYTITVTASGFEKLTQKNVHVNALETQSFSPKLTIGGGDQTVTVDTLPPQLETTNATLGATLDQDIYSALPIEMGAYGQADQRRVTDFAFLLPGVQSNNTNGNATTNTGVVNGSGSRGAASDVYIDGLPFVRAGGNGDPRFVWTAFSVDSIDQLQVQTTGYSAIYEGQGIQNYTVKAGGTKYHGSIYEFFRNTALDTYGWLGSVPNLATGKVTKPIEHSNEYGINLSGPLLPFGSWKDKLFFFGNYNGFRYVAETPTLNTFPTAAQQAGNFQGVLNTNTGAELASSTGVGIYDPNTQTACTAANAGKPCRYRYGFGPGGTVSATNPGGALIQCAAPYTCVDVIPAGEFSQYAKNVQALLPAGIGTANSSNYVSPNRNGLTNFSTTDRIDYIINPKHTLTFLAAIGRQASSNPAGQTTSGRNVGPIPFSYGQTFAPKTAVGIIEETYTITQHLVNQFKYGYARYNGPTYDADQLPPYAASTLGITGTPTGAASSAFPIATFAGTNPPTQWGGTTPNVTLAENYTLVDNVQWVKGNHTLTFGGEIAWMLYNTISATGGSTPVTLAYAVTETEGLNNAYTAISGSGQSYASFLVGQNDSVSLTQYLQQEFGARFRPVSPYVQDTWKVTRNLTLDFGLRYDFYPSVREVHDAQSYFSPTLANPVTGVNGALQFTGTGAGTCNCDTPVQNYHKNIGPRIGLAYQIDPKTVIHATYGVIFSHGDAVGGLATSIGTLGFSTTPKPAVTGTLLSSAPFTPTSAVFPAYAQPLGVASGPAFGTGYTTTPGYTAAPVAVGYVDPYLGGRAPEYITYSFGVQHQWTNTFSSSMSYVGSQGHFLQADGTNARGYYADQLDPKYLGLGSKLTDTGANLTADCANASLGITCPAGFTTSQNLAAALKPFPFQAVSDSFGYVANANYNSVQISANMRPTRGITLLANYTWSKAIDDGGTFRSGYALPAGSVAGLPNTSFRQDRIERGLSTTDQPQHLVVTGVYALPFGKTIAATHAWERAVFGGYKVSEIFQAFSGSPLAVTASTCQTNPALSTCVPTLNPGFSGPAFIGGKWGAGAVAPTSTGPAAKSFIVPSTNTGTGASCVISGPFVDAACVNTAFAPAYTFPNANRTAPYDLFGPGNYQLDMAVVRSFPLHFSETARFNFRAEMYNLTNKTFFSVVSTQVGNSAFGTVTPSTSYNRRAAQFSARIEF